MENYCDSDQVGSCTGFEETYQDQPKAGIVDKFTCSENRGVMDSGNLLKGSSLLEQLYTSRNMSSDQREALPFENGPGTFDPILLPSSDEKFQSYSLYVYYYSYSPVPFSSN